MAPIPPPATSTGATQPPQGPTQVTYNHDIKGLCQRMNQFIQELYQSVSNGVNQMNAADQTRLASYLTNIDTYQAWVVAQPQLDMPKTTGRQFVVDDFIIVNDVENEEVNDLLRIWQIQRDEILSSQSSRLGSGLIAYDAARLTAFTTKMRNFLNNYVQTATPVDLPASSPDEPLAPAPVTGV